MMTADMEKVLGPRVPADEFKAYLLYARDSGREPLIKLFVDAEITTESEIAALLGMTMAQFWDLWATRLPMNNENIARELGVKIEPFGGNTLLLAGYPAMLANMSPLEVLRGLIDQLLSGGKLPDRHDLLEDLLHTIACKAAIKAGVSAYIVAGMQPERLQPTHRGGNRASSTCSSWPLGTNTESLTSSSITLTLSGSQD